MTSTKTPAREALAAIATEHGWTVAGTDRRGAFIRGEEFVGVSYSEAGQVRSAQWNVGNGHASGRLIGFLGTGGVNKQAVVTSWLAR